jgi:hypothetical protein
MKSSNKRKNMSIEDERLACREDSMSGSKRMRRNPRQQAECNFVVEEGQAVPPKEEVSSLSSSSRVSSGDSLHTLSSLGVVKPDNVNSQVGSLLSPTSSASDLFELSRIQREERKPATKRATIAPRDSSVYGVIRKVDQAEPKAEKRRGQRNHMPAVISPSPVKGSIPDSACPTTNTPPTSSSHPVRRGGTALSSWRSWVLGFVLVVCGVRRYLFAPLREHRMDFRNETAIPSSSAPRTIYVPGYGFSGFWYILGRLQSIPEPLVENDYFCYSAGCMGVVATLLNMSMVEIHQEAVRIQNQWKAGEISRYEVVEHFVSWMLLPLADQSVYDSTSIRNMLSSLKVITSAPGQWWGVQPVVRSPASIPELREMLIQTTWIPFATGGAVWHAGGHNDGAFTSPFHPTCDLAIGLTSTNFMSSLDLLLNVVNVNLSRRKVEEFWNLGIADGVV